MTVRGLWLAWCAVVLAAALAMLGLPPPAPDRDLAQAGPGRLVLPDPAPAPAPPQDSLETLATATLWGPRAARLAAAGEANAPSPVEPAWQVSGTYLVQGQRHAVLTYEGLARPSQTLRVGDRLPDGARILRIEADRLQLQSSPGRRTRTHWLAINRGLPLPG